MALARFLVEQIPEKGDVRLDETESNHAAKVLRVEIGEDVLVFDGNGYEGFGVIHELRKREVIVRILGKRFAPRDHDGRLQFAIAMPKGERQRNVIERAVELGVDRLIPLHTHRSVAKLDADALRRLERYGLEACKQCQRNRRMRIEVAMDMRALIAWFQTEPSMQVWVLHPSRNECSIRDFTRRSSHHADASTQVSRKLLFLIGPEGGFTDEEVEHCRSSGCQVLDLGERILRVETAVAAAATLGQWVLSLASPPNQALPKSNASDLETVVEDH